MTKTTYTIIDLAKMLGMSKSTVSRALRDQYDVKPETRQKGLQLANKLDFKTNTLAASLRENKSYIIRVIRSPSLTTMAQPIDKIGRTTVELLLEHLKNPQEPPQPKQDRFAH